MDALLVPPIAQLPSVARVGRADPHGAATSARRSNGTTMSLVALKMLTGDRAKYLALIFAIACSSFLIAQQASIFSGLMNRTRSQILDVADADVWVMHPATQYVDEIYALTDNDLSRVRGVPGVQWAVPFFKGLPRAKAPDGGFRVVILLGVDDASLVGVPRKMLLGSIERLREPDAAIIDAAGFRRLFPKQPLTLNRTLELNDHRVRIVGICDASPPFTTFPVMYTRYRQALQYVGRERNQLSFVLVKPKADVAIAELTKRIAAATGLKAVSTDAFGWMTIWYYIRNTGIPVNFGLTVIVAIIVGTVVAGQTFHIFTIENLKQFGALKAIGTTNRRIVSMIVLQALVVGVIGYAIGMGMTALFFVLTTNGDATRGFVLLWQVMAGAGVIVLAIVIAASLMSVRRVLVLSPAEVFRG